MESFPGVEGLRTGKEGGPVTEVPGSGLKDNWLKGPLGDLQGVQPEASSSLACRPALTKGRGNGGRSVGWHRRNTKCL